MFRYYVKDSFNSAEASGTKIDDELLDCYEDSFVVGEFETDEDAVKATLEKQSADDIGVDDWDCSTPWGCPWEWSDGMQVPRGVVSAYDMGREWFEQNRAKMLGISPEDERTLLDSMGSQASGEDVKKFLDWGVENHVDVVDLAKHGEENEFYEALEKCFGKGAE